MSLDMRKISQLEHRLFSQTYAHLKSMPEIQLYSPERSNGGIISFNVKGAHPFDTGTLLDKYGIAVRTGHHCTQPLMQHFGIPGTVRVSFAMYNTPEDCERFITALHKTIKMLS